MESIKKIFLFVLVGLFMTTFQVKADEMKNNTLSKRQRDIITISAYTANGEIEKLKNAINEALDDGMTINEIKEILVQLYAYTGFPRSLNGLHAFMAVLDERKAKGLQDKEGKLPDPMPENWNRNEYGAKVRANLFTQGIIPAPAGYQIFAPVIDQFLKEHLFADIFSRNNLDYSDRELATISALASIPGLESQLLAHMGGAMNTGITPEQMKDFIFVLDQRLGTQESQKANAVLEKAIAKRK